MKICLYQKDYPVVFHKCSHVLSAMDYTIHLEDIKTGKIAAFKNGLQTRVFDLEVYSENGCITIEILSGVISRDFENISQDEKTGNVFAEHLNESLRTESGLNSFRLSEDDYISFLGI